MLDTGYFIPYMSQNENKTRGQNSQKKIARPAQIIICNESKQININKQIAMFI